MPLVVLGGLLALTTVAFGCYNLIGLMAHDRVQTGIGFDTVDAIVLDLGGGGVELRAANGPGSGVTGTRTVDTGLRSPSFEERLEGTTLHLVSRCPTFSGFHCGVHYALTVPAGVRVNGGSSGGGIDLFGLSGDVNVSSSGGGIDASGTTGALTLDSSGGGIDVTGSSGPLDLSSSGGGVQVNASRSATVRADSSGGGVTLQFDAPPTNVDARSSGGGVRVVVPVGDEAYAVDASSSGGGTHNDVNTNQTSSRHLRVSSSGGGVTIGYPPRNS